MKYRHLALAGLLCWLLIACASIGLEAPKSLADRITYAYGVNAGLRSAAANSLTAGTIQKQDATYVLNVTDQTRTMLDASQMALNGGDPKTAEGRLVLALNVLDELQSYLSKKVQKP